MTTLMQAHNQWLSRPADERFVDLFELKAKVDSVRKNSIGGKVSTRDIKVVADPNHGDDGIAIEGRQGLYNPTHYSFGQLASLAGAPAGYLRTLHPALVADCMNYGLQINRDAEDVGLLRTRPESGELMVRAATGPNYGRVWNADIVRGLTDRFGDGRTGDFRIPGEFGREVAITKANTTLFASDRDIFIFLCDEKNRIEMKNRRDGQGGSLARGFFVWNSEVGAATLGIAMFLFDYVCANRIVWGVEGFREVKIRHTASAPHKWVDEVEPVIEAMAESSAKPVEQRIQLAQETKLRTKVEDFLANRKFTANQISAIKRAHEDEEHRPMETVWDVTTGITAYAKSIRNQDDRVKMERAGGQLLDLVAA